MLSLSANVDALLLGSRFGPVVATVRYRDPDYDPSAFHPDPDVPIYMQDTGEFVPVQDTFYQINPKCERLNPASKAFLLGAAVVIFKGTNTLYRKPFHCRNCELVCSLNLSNVNSPEPIKVYPVEP